MGRYSAPKLAEIIRISLQLEPARRSGVQFSSDPVLVSIGLRGGTARKGQLHLRLGVARTRPAHQRIRPLGLRGSKFEDPFVKPGLARLHGVFGALKDTCRHAASLAANRCQNQAPLMLSLSKH